MVVQQIAKSKTGVFLWLILAVVVFGASVGGGFWVATRQGGILIEVDNKQSLFTPEVSNNGLEEYLRYTGLSEQVKRVVVTYESAELATVAYTRKHKGAVDVMMDLKVEEKVVNIWLYYNPDLFEYMLATPDRIAGVTCPP